jgi:hypothetical protein
MSMQSGVQAATKYVALVGALTFAATMVLVFLWVAAIPRDFVGSFLPDQTIYASDFRKSKFSEIHQGMTRQDVLNLVGHPLEVLEVAKVGEELRDYRTDWHEGPSALSNVQSEWWFFSRPGRLAKLHWYYRVSFDEGGRVEEAISAHVE